MNPLTGWKIIDRGELRQHVSYLMSHEREIKQSLEYNKRLEKARAEVYERYRNFCGDRKYFYRCLLPQIHKSVSEKYNVSIDDLPKL